jgi:hypothetical protein
MPAAPTAQATKAARAAAAAAPFPRSAADFAPDEYKLKCCICRKLFRGGGHNPGGFSVRYRNKRTGEASTYRYPHSKWGSKVHRCCDSCDARVQLYRGESDGRGQKRRRPDEDANDPSLGAALGSGACRSPFAHSDPAVLAAIAAIRDDDVRHYAEQRCTEASLQQILRENPAHAYFRDRLHTLYESSIDGQHAAAIFSLQHESRFNARWRAELLGQLRERDRVADELVARVRELYDRVHELEQQQQQQQQQPVVHAEAVAGGGGDEDRDAADDDIDETA